MVGNYMPEYIDPLYIFVYYHSSTPYIFTISRSLVLYSHLSNLEYIKLIGYQLDIYFVFYNMS